MKTKLGQSTVAVLAAVALFLSTGVILPANSFAACDISWKERTGTMNCLAHGIDKFNEKAAEIKAIECTDPDWIEHQAVCANYKKEEAQEWYDKSDTYTEALLDIMHCEDNASALMAKYGSCPKLI